MSRKAAVPAPAARAAAGLALAALLAACSVVIDREEAARCRLAAVAVEPAGSRITVEAVRAAPAPFHVAVDYAVQRPGAPPGRAGIACAFARGADPARPLALTALSDATGPMGEARLFFLNRFLLDDPEARATLTPPAPVAALVVTSDRVAVVLQQAVNAALPTVILALVAAAVGLVHAVVGRIDLALGHLATYGGYAALMAGVALGAGTAGIGPPALAAGLAAALLAGAAGGVALARLVHGPLAGRGGVAALVATFALGIVIAEALRLGQGVDGRWLPPARAEPVVLAAGPGFAAVLAPATAAVVAVGAVFLLALVLLMARTPLGLRLRAVAEDPRAAALFGIDVASVRATAVVLAALLAAAAGALVTLGYGGGGPQGGIRLAVEAVLAAIIGGIDRVSHAILGAITVGLAGAVWRVLAPAETAEAGLLALVVVVALARPFGLFGASPEGGRPV